MFNIVKSKIAEQTEWVSSLKKEMSFFIQMKKNNFLFEGTTHF